ncbi:MAG: hypothetical protein PHT26_10565 [Lentimicrobiaceae bacterium]|jgi:hypothetical protein|nr:hypothetical protein [Lentimicrobiaceae bacterium]
MKKQSPSYSIFIGLLLLIALIFVLNQYATTNILKITAFIIAVVFIFSLVVRKIAWFKPYFTSKFNLLTNKTRHKQEFDFSRDLLFDKMLEVMTKAGFKISKVNKETGDIYATTGMSWLSWGENIYVTMEEVNGITTVDFFSATFFQVYDWGRNENNYRRFISEFEDSLTI